MKNSCKKTYSNSPRNWILTIGYVEIRCKRHYLDSVRAVTNQWGSPLYMFDYDVFGQPLQDRPERFRHGFTGNRQRKLQGKEYDSWTGLYNYGFRDYSSLFGRFTTVDPIQDGRNWYAYVNSDPVSWLDPWGLKGQLSGEDRKKKKTPAIYYDNFGNPSFDPNVITGENLGEPSPHILTANEVYNRIKNAVVDNGLMGKAYSEVTPVYVCTSFAQEALTLSGLNANEFLPGGQRVKDSMSLLQNDSLYFTPDKGSNPEEGTYVFYYLYADGNSGHTGFIHFDDEGNATILHNGSNCVDAKLVNEYVCDNRDFATWFQEKNPGSVYYKPISIVEGL